MTHEKSIYIKGARVHNLKNIEVEIPHDKLVVVTGLSGSGKSTLAFDTIFAEGQRRYVESLSAYARQFLGKINKPDVDIITGIAPAIAIEQKVNTRNPRSTVGTTTEIYDYLKLLFARIGHTFSPVSGQEVRCYSVDDVATYIQELGEGSRAVIAAPLVLAEGQGIIEKLTLLLSDGLMRVYTDGQTRLIEEILPSIDETTGAADIQVVIDRMRIAPDDDTQTRIRDSVARAFSYGDGICTVISDKGAAEFSSRFEADGIEFEHPSEHLFSFNNPLGACPRCEGYGKVIGIDEDLVIPDKGKTIYEDAIACWRGETMRKWKEKLVENAYKFDFPIHTPFHELTQEQKRLLWRGNQYFHGLDEFFAYIDSERRKIQFRVMKARYTGKTTCPECGGSRLRKEALYVRIGGRNIADLVVMPVDELIEELLARTGYLAAVGALPDGPRCREDLLSFTAWAAGAGRAGLPSLIRAMDAAAANGGLSQSAGGQTRPGCVSIMTVHRSKGLEFPVVFVADTDHKFNQSDAIRPVLTHSRLGVGVMLRAPRAAKRFKTLPYAALAQAIRTETLSEEMRVLYVALTRAQDALLITVPLKKTASSLKLPALCAAAEATGPEAMRSMTSWAGWILTAALLHPDSSALWEYTSFLPHHRPTEVPLTIRLVALPENAEQPPAPRAPQPDPATVEMLKASFAWHSPRAALEKVPAKVSVSAVAHAARPVALERPAFLQKTGMTGAERGTAIHAFMQSVPFDGPAPDLDAEVRRQTDLQLLDPALADKLDLDAVRPFFASAVWRRIRLAKQILREEPFITALPAAEVTPAAGQGSAAAEEVLVQGIADLVLVFDEHAEILDYKTDRSRDAQYYIDEYAAQLRLYRRAFAQRLAVPVTKLTIYSFAIEDEIDVPLG